MNDITLFQGSANMSLSSGMLHHHNKELYTMAKLPMHMAYEHTRMRLVTVFINTLPLPYRSHPLTLLFFQHCFSVCS